MINGLSPEERDMLSPSATQLLQQLGLGDAFRFERLSGGRNNRVYRVTGRSDTVVLKWYFRSADDDRDRLSAEYSFYEYALKSGVTCLAAPLGIDHKLRIAVYSLLEGQHMDSGQVKSGHIDQALDLIRRLNAHRSWSYSESLPLASEACFSIQQHIDCISGRVEQLRTIGNASAQHREASVLAEERIVPALTMSVKHLERWAAGSQADLHVPLSTIQRCVSPSDFGFHNALISADGQLSFFDFEYAGWDDPAKLLCDFYCQPDVPAPHDTWEQFADLAAELAGDTPLERQRQALLLPLYQVKWCCILLNEFVATSRDRREFAEEQPSDLGLQLEKARRAANQLTVI